MSGILLGREDEDGTGVNDGSGGDGVGGEDAAAFGCVLDEMQSGEAVEDQGRGFGLFFRSIRGVIPCGAGPVRYLTVGGTRHGSRAG